MTRVDPVLTGPERQQLMSWLQYHRETLTLKCEGLGPDDLVKRSVAPSTMSLIGLVRHMAEVERNWFRRLLNQQGHDTAGRIYCTEANPDGEFDDVDAATVDHDVAVWRAECEAADAIVAPLGLDETRPDPAGDEISVRWVLIHMIEEYARHNGHADLIREAIDGVTGD